MKRTRISVMLTLCCILGIIAAARGQSDWKVGFEIGWTNSTFNGELETVGGEEVESYGWVSGFAMSLFVRRYLTDEFALQSGFGFAQRNVVHDFDGRSYHLFDRTTASGRLTEEPTFRVTNRVEEMQYQLGYFDVPLMAVYQVGKFEFGAGVYGALMISSKGEGDLGVQPLDDDNAFEPFIIQVDARYLRDDFGDMVFGNRDVTPVSSVFGNEEPRIVHAYHNYFEDPNAQLFTRWEAGGIAHVGYYFNKSLNIKAKFLYGLTDRTRRGADYSRTEVMDESTNVFRDDFDRHLSVQVTVGFFF